MGKHLFHNSLTPLNFTERKAIRLTTFSIFHEHTSPLFKKKLNIIKLHDLVSHHIAVFMYRFKNRLLPPVFDTFFSKVSDIHQYNTRSAAKPSYYLPRVRTNYGKFSIRFQGPKIWNLFNDHIKSVSFALFKSNLHY